jgi:hypothetical protein
VTADKGKKGESPELEDEDPDAVDAPPSDVRRARPSTEAELRWSFAPSCCFPTRKGSDADVEDIALAANVAVLTSTSRRKAWSRPWGGWGS